MNTKILKFLYWMPRVLAIIFIVFLSLFALDVFEPGKTLSYYLIALFMHLIPNFMLIGLLIIAWRHEKVGGALFIIISLIFTILFKTYLSLPSFLFISVPAFLIGVMFFLHDSCKKILDK